MKFLPICIIFIIIITFITPSAFAAENTIQAETEAITECQNNNQTEETCYVRDKDLQFAAKVAARSKEVLRWATAQGNFQWIHLSSGQNSPFPEIWIIVRNTVYGLLGLAILAASFLMIITRGKSLTVRKFIPRFIFIVILVVLSFSLVKFLYDVTDIIQGFFLTSPADPSHNINNDDLLNIGFQYVDPVGYRLKHLKFDEQVWITTLLLKLTAATYYAMFAILAIRKIILWFFILISPILPLLILFPLIRNSAKLWIGEFFRWLLYAPLFAIFLNGLVRIWRSQAGIPLGFPCYNQTSTLGTTDQNPIFQTATDVLLGGPCQQLGLLNNINSPDTFVQYLIALLMLWVVIILPFILLKIFLDYFSSYSLTESNIVKYLAQQSSPVLNRYGLSSNSNVSSRPPAGEPPEGSGSTGLAKSIPSFEHSAVKELEERMAESAQRQQMTSSAATSAATSVLEKAYEQNQKASEKAISSATSSVTDSAINQIYQQTQAGQAATQAYMQTPLKISVEEARNESISTLYPKIAANFVANIQTPVAAAAGVLQQAATEVMNLTSLTLPTIKDIVRFETSVITGEAKEETSKISEIINRIAGVSPITTPAEKEKYAGIKERLVAQAQKGNAVAFSVLSASAPGVAAFPESNRVQQINLDDYEQVKKMWMENYRKLEPPNGSDGRPQNRKNWLKQEIKKIPEVIDLLLSGDPEKVKKGKDMVSKILPFLLLGGFSLAEIVAYLKAKLEAAKQVLNEVLQVEEDEDSKVKVETKKQVAPKAMSAEIPEPASPVIASDPELVSGERGNLTNEKNQK